MAASPDEAVHHGTSFVQRKNVPGRAGKSAKKILSAPLKPNRAFLIFFAAAGRRSGRLMGPALRRAPVVSGAARNQLALWRIWLCAHTTLLPSGARPSASIAFST